MNEPLIAREAVSDPIHEALRAAVCVPTRRYLWVPEDTIEFVPALSSTIYGDGRALLALTTINSRPRFYVVRIDSSWCLETDRDAPAGATDVRDFIDEIGEGLEEEFGSGRLDEEEDDADGPDWPALDDRDGVAWGRHDWPNLPGLNFVPHPYTWRARLLAAAAPTPAPGEAP